MNFVAIASKLPGIQEPKTHLSFKSRLKWTGIILLLFIILSHITLFGISPEERVRFQFFELILGSSIGTLMTLGIGPIVTASIILQLLVGSKIIPWNLQDPEGRRKFQSAQKLLVIFFCVFEAFAYVSFGAIRPASPDAGLFVILIAQIAFGGYLVLLMDEVISKWGIGSGVSLFIAENVTRTIFVRAFNPITPAGETIPAGLIPQSIAFISLGDMFQAMIAWVPIIATIIVFLTVVYIQSMKVEIPLAFGSIRGFSRRWPLNLIYTSNMPVILIAALLANLQLVGTMMARPTETGLRCGFLGCFDQNNNAVSGAVQFLQPASSLSVRIFFLIIMAAIFIAAFSSFYFRIKHGVKILGISAVAGVALALTITASTTGLPTGEEFLRAGVYSLILIGGSVVFSIFWVSTSGMDARSVAEQIEGLGMQIPGFRRDPRIVEQVLNRYIPTLAIISGLFIGTLAAMADFTGALGTGTGILLTVMIIYGLYENIASRYMEDMHPAMRKFFR
ncbi:MAG: preprotein translocase subunit SecY [Candidatus Aenigmarchaeota archaeon]|nr:preprotein translocase subunit SecY [Candidatus Aenigmarchaeota archaeon]MDI6722097.1 preprotein translocase subunit SecY [Candidatus Aenigmarchaeota archaeon]